nr:MAG: wsv151-like protein [Penaeus semisulcatus pemonivirus]
MTGNSRALCDPNYLNQQYFLNCNKTHKVPTTTMGALYRPKTKVEGNDYIMKDV